MAKPRKVKQITKYTYVSVTGELETIRLGEESVTEEWLAFLEEDEHAIGLQERYHLEHVSYKFLNSVTEHSGLDLQEYVDPIDLIPDPHSNIFDELFEDSEAESRDVIKLRRAMKKLTRQQRKLLKLLFEEEKTVTEIAKELDIPRGAIQERRRKAILHLKKLLSD